jgi:hypothetical protein
MKRNKHKKTGPTRRGMAAAARAIGRAFGLFKKIRFRRRRGCAARDTQKSGRARRRLSAKQRALEAEILRLETELDEVYARVVEGAGHVKRNESDPATPELADIIDLSRDLREQLRAKRAELTRLERDAAREVRLQRAVPPVMPPEQEPEPFSPQPDDEPAASGLAVLDERLRERILKASRKAEFADSSQLVIFEKLTQDLLADDPEVRRTAAARMGELDTPASFDVLHSALEDPDDKVCAAALNSLALLGDDTSPGVFRRYTDSSEHHLRLAALRGLARVGDSSDDSALLAALEDSHPAVRKSAATYLGWRDAAGAARALISALHDEEDEVRAAAAASLGNLRSSRAVLSLIRILEDPDTGVRQAAKKAIETIVDEKVQVDIEAEAEGLKKRIQELKEWWKEARIDKQLKPREHREPEAEPAQAKAPAKKPAPRGVDPAAEDPAKVVDLKSAAASRTKPAAAKKPAKKPAEEKPKEDEEKQEESLLESEDSEMPAELEGLGTVKASAESEPEADEMPDGLDGLGIRVADEKEEETKEEDDSDESPQEGEG